MKFTKALSGKNITTYLFVTCISIILLSCNNTTNNLSQEKINIEIDSINIDKINIDNIENCSFVGFSGIKEDSIYFFDRVLSYIYTISIDGKIGSRQLGLGHSANELIIKNSPYVCYEPSNQTFNIMGGTYDLYLYGSDKKTKRIDMKPQGNKESFESSTAYTLWDEVLMTSDKDYVYYNVIGNNEKVDIFNRKDYLKNAHIIMRVSKKDGTMSPIGHYSEFYDKNKDKIKHLPHYYFDTNGSEEFYITYQVDSLIYRCDKNFNIIDHFGVQGRDMNTNYTACGTTMESFANAITSDTNNVGQYYWLKTYKNYVFRSYFKSKDAKSDGLQIYKDGILIGDVDVPHNFKVIGKIKDYWVTAIDINEEQNAMSFYKFKF